MNLKEKIIEKKDQVKDWIEAKKIKIHDWLENDENKEFAKLVAPVIIVGGGALIKEASRRQRLSKEEELKTNFIYDRSNGHYYELKRQPKSKQWLEIDRRKDEGERVGDILKDMKLLK